MHKVIITLLLSLSPLFLMAQSSSRQGSYADKQGVLRQISNDAEITAFGANYSLPFAHAYRMARRMGVSPETAIDNDIYHMTRLGLDLYRVHIWDTEISDTLGNLLANEHLQLFDYTFHKMKQRGFRFVLTPIAFWGNGWPEPDEATPGFAAKYGKAACLTHPDAIRAQEHYLQQFLDHINPYTGLAYREDPSILAFEVSNEPHHGGSMEEVRTYINRMVAAMRSTGTPTPILYNMSHSIHLLEAYLDAEVQGGTFQWNPTNLVANHQLQGNFLPHVDEYYLPFGENEDFKKQVKIVYEFDPADIGQAYMYPAMARSFRTAGMQLATHFDYDAQFLAPYNTNYGTHYMSLPYAPQKALGLKIAGEVFRHLPRYEDYGQLPNNLVFGDARISYSEDLSEWVNEKQFFYSNNTSTQPPAAKKLEQVAGYGSSPLVAYDGKGAYFLDKIEKGLWRLEVMPDAHQLDDPYAPASPHRQAAAVTWQKRAMTISLEDLGPDFKIEGRNEGNQLRAQADDGHFIIQPGVYLLKHKANKTSIQNHADLGRFVLNEFVAPKANLPAPVLHNYSPRNHTAGHTATLDFELIADQQPTQVSVAFLGNRHPAELKASYLGQDRYRVELDSSMTTEGLLRYSIVAEWPDSTLTFPGASPSRPGDWEHNWKQQYEVLFTTEKAPLLLWDAAMHLETTLHQWHPGLQLLPEGLNNAAWHMSMDHLPQYQHKGNTVHDFSFKFFFKQQTGGRTAELAHKKELCIAAENKGTQALNLEVGLIDDRGVAFTIKARLQPGEKELRLPLEQLEQGAFVLIKRPYPDFMPFFHQAAEQYQADLHRMETLQFSVRQDHPQPVDLSVRRIWVE